MSDPVTPEMRLRVIERDGRRCMAPVLDYSAGPCRDRWGQPIYRYLPGDLTLDHVQDGGGRMGKRAPSDAGHLVTLCWGHHTGTEAGRNWATSHRPLLREYLVRVSGNEEPPSGRL